MVKAPQISILSFARHFAAYKALVESKTNEPFIAFPTFLQPDVTDEVYKYRIYREGQAALGYAKWKTSDIGAGTIYQALLRALNLPGKNNLVDWRLKDRVARLDKAKRDALENALFQLYRSSHDRQSFESLVKVFGAIYPLLGYVCFLKDKESYLPIGPETFDRAFHLLGTNFKTSSRCSWENYQTFLSLIRDLRDLLTRELEGTVSLLDAHSFAWVIGSQLDRDDAYTDSEQYIVPTATEREAIVKARIGQSKFRKALVHHWKTCAVTGCSELLLLHASHIKPWATSTNKQRHDPFNGLLLSPSLDKAFDCGQLSFTDDGRIILSPKVSKSDWATLGIHAGMRIRQKLHKKHLEYLASHRKRYLLE